MDREKPVRKNTDVIPITPGSSLMNRRGQSWLERDFDSIFDDFRKSFDVLMRPYFPLEMQMLERPGALSTRYARLMLSMKATTILFMSSFRASAGKMLRSRSTATA